MNILNSTQSLFTTTRQHRPGTSDGAASFLLPDSDDGSQAPSIGSTDLASSIASGFWLNKENDPSGASDGTKSASGDGTSSALSGEALLAEFARLANMTPAEKIRARYLEAHHMTEEQFSQLPADQQKAISDEIAKEIKETLGVGNSKEDKKTSDGAQAALALG